MGEAKQEETKVETKEEEKKEEKQEEKKEEKQEEKKEEKPAEEKKEEAKPSPPLPIVLSMDLHCVGCARKIERSIVRCKGVESVEVDMVQNQVTVTGMVDPQVLCARIQKKTRREVKVLSPPPPEGDAKPEAVAIEAPGLTTVELLVNMHCEACAHQLKKRILKMRGVQTAETDMGAGKVTVTGTMKGEKLVEYIHRRTGKLARIVPPPPPPPKEEEKKPEEPAEKKPEENPPEEKKEEKKAEEGAPEKKEEEKPPEQPAAEEGGKQEVKGDEQKKEAAPVPNMGAVVREEDMMKRMMMYWNGGGVYGEEEMAKGRMVHWMPIYVIERPPPPPQMFSDENPNACCIS